MSVPNKALVHQLARTCYMHLANIRRKQAVAYRFTYFPRYFEDYPIEILGYSNTSIKIRYRGVKFDFKYAAYFFPHQGRRVQMVRSIEYYYKAVNIFTPNWNAPPFSY